MAIVTTDSQNPDLMAIDLPQLAKKAESQIALLKCQLSDALDERIKQNSPSQTPAVTNNSSNVLVMPARRQTQSMQNTGVLTAMNSRSVLVQQKPSPYEERAKTISMNDLANKARDNDIKTVKIGGNIVPVESCFSAIQHHQNVANSCHYLIKNVGTTMFLPRAPFGNMTAANMLKTIGKIVISEAQNLLSGKGVKFFTRESAIANAGELRSFGLQVVSITKPAVHHILPNNLLKELDRASDDTIQGSPNTRRRAIVPGTAPVLGMQFNPAG